MRPLKFRFWNKLAHRFQPPSKYAIQGDGQCIGYDYEMMAWDDPFDIEKSFIVAQQFTGLKDKNDKEVYIGDIVEWEFGNRKRVLVRWTEEYHDFHPAIIHYDSWSHGGSFEVIGNIFENPELLEQ